MGFFKNLKQGLDAARNPPSPEQIEAMLASLTPEQRAAYEANMAHVEAAQAESQASWEQAAAINDRSRVLGGPAGRHLYGPSMRESGSPTELQARIAEVGVLEAAKEMRAAQKGEFTNALRQTLNLDHVDELEDPAERERVAAAERAARADARAPYRAPAPVQAEITRIATRGESQVAELADFLGSSGLAAAPERVFGVYRVPDRISQALTIHSEKGRVVEWDVVHAPGPPLGAVTPPAITSFAAGDRWVGRRVGEPAVLDEDVGIAFLRAAGIGPLQCFGLARYSEFRSLRSSDQESDEILTLVRGLVAVHPSGDGGAYERMRAAAPIAYEPDPGVHIEVLRWREVADAVHPKVNHPPPVPSPFPYLPATPQELLRGYIEVVGLRPEDCFSTQATVNHARALVQGGMFTTNLGPRQPCADGEPRMRSHGCEIVVFVYRERPEYAAGRERWARYEAEVLEAQLARGAPRPAITSDDELEGVPRVLRPIVKAAELYDRVTEFEWGGEDIVPHRYCWPPVA